MEFELRKAILSDMAAIFQLYTGAYDGTYPDPTFSDVSKLESAIQSQDKLIFVACDSAGKLVGSILFLYEEKTRLSKAGAAVVAKSCRGKQLTQKLIKYGTSFIQENCCKQHKHHIKQNKQHVSYH